MLNKIVFVFSTMLFLSGYSQTQKFKVVLDAGHGGKDYGAVYHGNIEKNIALQTALRVGAILEKDPQIEVVYTRKSDVFIELQQRATIANKSKGSIFVSMHCNANKNQSASGNETYVMGITRNASNLEVAKSENEVVTLETDYKIKYDGFDPNSPESVIGISILQEEHLDQSIELAGRVQQFFTKKTDSKNRGVKQAGFLVLHQTSMPSVLIETGFLTNVEEEKFLNSEIGQDYMASAIFRAFKDYKNELEIKIKQPEEEKKEEVKVEEPIVKEEIKKDKKDKKKEDVEEGVVFKVQIATSSVKTELKPENFKGIEDVGLYEAGGLYRYTVGKEKNLNQANVLQLQLRSKGFEDAFIVAFKDGKRIPISEAIKLQEN